MTAINAPAIGNARVNFPGILRSEWRKLFSLRSTWILSLIGAGIVVIFAAFMPLIIGFVTMAEAGTEASDMDMPSAATQQFAGSGLMIGGLLWACAVIVSVAGEYSSHSAVSTLSAVPTRWPAYVAKAVATGIVGFLGGVIFHLLSSLVVVLVFALFGIDAEFGGASAFGEAALSGVYILVLTWMAVGLAALLRSTAGSIVILAVFVYLVTSVVQGFMAFVDQDWLIWIGNHLPTEAVDQLRPSRSALFAGADTGGVDMGGLGTGIAAWDSWLTTAVWALVPLGLGSWAFQRRGVR